MNIDRDRSSTKCYWESQPTGCTKPHCPFLHEKIKDPYEPELVVPNPVPVVGKIIVNKNKLDSIMLPIANRTVIAPARSVKERLGTKVEENVEVFEYSDSEEESLRKGALGTLDLRLGLPDICQ